MDNHILQVTGLSKSFGGVAAVSGVSLTVPLGGVVGLIGPNGSGKTTLFSLIAGHQRADSGHIIFDGIDITNAGGRRTARARLLRSFQQPRIYTALTCLENVLLGAPEMQSTGARLLRPPTANAVSRAQEALDFVGLAERRGERAGDLSFGQQKLLEFSMALAARPRLLLLDEPTAGVAPARIAPVLAMLRQARQAFGLTLFVIEHNMPALMQLAETAYCLADGAVIAAGAPAEVATHARVRAAYMGRTPAAA